MNKPHYPGQLKSHTNKVAADVTSISTVKLYGLLRVNDTKFFRLNISVERDRINS